MAANAVAVPATAVQWLQLNYEAVHAVSAGQHNQATLCYTALIEGEKFAPSSHVPMATRIYVMTEACAAVISSLGTSRPSIRDNLDSHGAVLVQLAGKGILEAVLEHFVLTMCVRSAKTC